MKKFKWLFIIAAPLLVLFLGALGYWFTMDKDTLRKQLTTYASQKLNRELVITGDISPSFSLTEGFGVTVKGASLANADGFSPKNMMSLDTLELVIDPFALLSHEVHIRKLVIEGADVTLQQVGAQNNWNFAGKTTDEATVAPPADDSKAPPMAIGFDSVEAKDITLTRIVDGVNSTYKIESLEMEAASDDPVSFSLKATVNGQPVTADVKAGTLADIQSGQKQDISIDAVYGEQKFSVDADYRRDGDTHHITGATIDYNNMRAAGDIMVDLGGKVPSLTLNLIMPELDFTKFGNGKDIGAKSADDSDAPVFSHDPLPWDMLSKANIDAQIDIKSLITSSGNMGPANIQAKIANGNMTSSIIVQPTGAKKPITLKANANANRNLAVSVNAPSIEPTLLMGDDPVIQAPASFLAEISGHGNSLHDVMAGANGQATLRFEPGTLNAKALPVSVEGALASFVGLDKIQNAKMACAVVDMGIANGIATTRGIGVDSAPIIAAGDGQINLGAENVNLRLVAEPLVAVAKGTRIPIYIKGALKRPTVMADTGAVAGQAVEGATGFATRVIGDDKISNIAGKILGATDKTLVQPHIGMPFNPCRPNDKDVAAPPATTAAPATTGAKPTSEDKIRAIVKDPKQLLNGLFGSKPKAAPVQ